ncbi:MAG: 30S ribosomal protein S2 [Bacteroidota bacterium]|nr:30S ribosomal protein S2 [Bacteroidota bacterium]MDP4231320.1 30S ribosomal protein S2 [Bacteroidota bacterium]MDP4237510.1 30S ribosomal protein S2 [Bacteroidota bacterium]
MRISLEDLLASGAHFGHLTRRWNPKMKPYIFMERNGIHIIDLKKSQQLAEDALNAAERLASEGKRFLFVGTKKQLRGAIKEEAIRCGQYHATDRWPGGMLTNFATIRKSIKRLQNLDKMDADGTIENYTKKEQLLFSREKIKLDATLGGISEMRGLPAAMIIIDIKKEHIAVDEARKLGIPIFALVDTNVDPDLVDYPIPANDDALRSVQLFVHAFADAINAGRAMAKAKKMDEGAEPERLQKESDIEEIETPAAEETVAA